LTEDTFLLSSVRSGAGEDVEVTNRKLGWRKKQGKRLLVIFVAGEDFTQGSLAECVASAC
jgi:hypothetical protein